MIQKAGTYPVYEPVDLKNLEQRVMVSFTYGQLVEIANVFYYFNKVLAGKWYSNVKLDETKRSLHKAIHDAAVNCAISLEEQFKLREGSNAAA
jgi:hypothetical protein